MAATTSTPKTYGNFRLPQTAGGFGFGAMGTTIVFVGLFVGLLIVMFSGEYGILWAVLWVLLVGVVLFALKTRDRDNKSALERTAERIGWLRTEGTGANLYRSGPIGRARWGTHQLPGLLASTTLTEHRDSYGRPFALIHMPKAQAYSIVFASEPAGASLIDQEVIDAQVANFGVFLATLADEPGLEAAQVTIETSPDNGHRLKEEVESQLDPNAPLFARTMLQQAVASYPAGGSTVRAYVSLTFQADGYGEKKRDAADMARDLAARIPNFTKALQTTGAGAMHPVAAQELCEVVLTAYDPAAAALIEQSYAQGETPDLTWSDVGPAAHEAGWGNYRHDSGHSVTWQMSQAPRAIVQSQVLGRLLSPHRDILRKRVTLIYKAIPVGQAADLVERDVNSATMRASGGKRTSARAAMSQRAANATAAEEASGAGVVDFGMLVTATVSSPEEEAFAVAALDSLSPTARIRLRRSYGSQDSAFAACLPLGYTLEKHLKLPKALRVLD